MGEPAEKPQAVRGEEAKRIKREALDPTDEQAEPLRRTFGACRWVYNELV
ncbi:helix-turn-helix domain-containing protein [Streptomyces sp. NBC_01136]|nr:helix-turn-helix domain-containing protein [Streptomyces sp. NBC_01136]